ncbi:integrase [Mycobacteroides chelonae]|uniref:tyrosine-type recombinase/integrase n=1 Tax=Mycobacteroides chelonae TaxID=1774 RepID=UPI0008A8508B|nr:tyrosine-type recombinase/integrase [Mycobacteroides chelonae]OHT78145.1 integrase [Mycobacteroides chelonae]
MVEKNDSHVPLALVQGVSFMHPEDAVFEAMLQGWEKQQLGGRLKQPKSVNAQIGIVRRFMKYTNEYPWNWSAAHMDEWGSDLISHARASSTIRNYQSAIRLFCDYITSAHYGWINLCENRFATHPVQICHEWNTTAHLVDYEGATERRPLTREELQRFFDYADRQVELMMRSGRKGALPAYRDSTVFKLLYGWGLRCSEASHLDVIDFHKNSKAPELKKFAMLHVRYGKRSRGSPHRRRMVHTLMPWAAEAVADYVENVRSLYRGGAEHPALFLTERGGRLQPRHIEERFAAYRDALGLDHHLTPHCLRHSYVTHLTEDGVDPKFIQEQVGHRFASTTGIYTAVSGDFMNAMMRKALDQMLTQESPALLNNTTDINQERTNAKT